MTGDKQLAKMILELFQLSQVSECNVGIALGAREVCTIPTVNLDTCAGPNYIIEAFILTVRTPLILIKKASSFRFAYTN